MKKVIFILFLIFVIRVFTACCRCSDETTTIHFNDIRIVPNGQSYYTNELLNYNTDTMFNSGLSFTVALSDTTIRFYPYDFSAVLSKFSFATANATTCDCFQVFRFDEEIVKISVYNLYELTPDIPANSNITDLFLIDSYKSRLYNTIDNAIPEINLRRTSINPSLEINLFCKETILNDSAQFIVNVLLSDNTTLSTFTPIFYLSEPIGN